MYSEALTPVMIDMTNRQQDDSGQNYAKGGLAHKAEQVRKAGRGGDSVLIHVNPEELAYLKEHFGPGGINPETGLMEFKKIWQQKWFAPAAAIASVVAAPFVGPALGAALFPSLVGETILGANAANVAGGALFGAGAGALTGGAKGALIGGVLGGAAPIASNAISGLFAPTAGAAGTGSFDTTSYTGAGAPLPPVDTSGVRDYSSAASAASTAAAKAPADAAGSGLASMFSADKLMNAAPLMLMGAALGGAGGGAKSTQPPADMGVNDTINSQHLDFTPLNRGRNDVDVDENYGYGPSKEFFKNNQLPQTVKAAEGRYMKGSGTGVSDDIPARLSDGEYVIDAQTVSMIGDGSSDAGAKRLDQMREQIRRQKGQMLAKGEMAPHLSKKGPLSYIKGA